MKILIVIPVYNEEEILEKNVLKLSNFLEQNITYDWQITIADNQSTDNSGSVGKKLANQYDKIDYLYINEKGKGAAIRRGWQKITADIYCFMDADLATDLSALPEVITAIIDQNYDLAIGSRWLKKSQVKRQLIRKIISFSYHLLAKIIIRTKIRDLPCGFKAVKKNVVEQILPQVKNSHWFFDSELVLVAEKQNFKIKEVAVKWQEPAKRKSRVNLFSIGRRYFLELIKLKKRLNKF